MENKNSIVKQYIIDRIEKKVYTAGQMIESEIELSHKLNISRMTVRKALDDLVNEGIIYKEKGRGTFVAQQSKYAKFQCGIGFTQEALRRGYQPSTKQASLHLIHANSTIANQLNIQVNDLVWEVIRVRCIDDLPVVYVCEYYIHAQCEDLTIEIINQSIYKHLKEKGIVYAYVDQMIEAVSCPKDIATALGIKQHHPVILMSLIAYMKNGVPFNCGFEYYRSDQYTLLQSVYNKDLY